MKRLSFLLLVLFTTTLISCDSDSAKNMAEALTGPKIEAYLNGYKALRAEAPGLLKNVNAGDLVEQKEGYNIFEATLKKNGLTYKEFVILNAKIGAIYSIQQGESFMGDMAEMKTAGMEQMDDGTKQMQAAIDDPNVPEEAKKELRKSLGEMKAAKEKINTDYDKNKGWADAVMDKTKTVTNIFVSREDIELVKQYADKITEAYTGMAPSNFKVPE
jgi:hypothetical protein